MLELSDSSQWWDFYGQTGLLCWLTPSSSLTSCHPNLSHLFPIVSSPFLVYLSPPLFPQCQIGSSVNVVVVLFFVMLFLMLRPWFCGFFLFFLFFFALIWLTFLFETLVCAFQAHVPPFSKSWIYHSSLFIGLNSSAFPAQVTGCNGNLL